MTAQAALQELVEVEMALMNVPDEFDERAAELRKKRRNILAFLGMPDAQTARRRKDGGWDAILMSKEKDTLIFFTGRPEPNMGVEEMFNELRALL